MQKLILQGNLQNRLKMLGKELLFRQPSWSKYAQGSATS